MNPDIIEVLYHGLLGIVNPGKYKPTTNNLTRQLGIETYPDRVKSYISYIPKLYGLNLKDYEISGVIKVGSCPSIVGLSAVCFLESGVDKRVIRDVIPYTDLSSGLQLILLYSLPEDIHSENENKKQKAFIKFIFNFIIYLLNNFSIMYRFEANRYRSVFPEMTIAAKITDTIPLFLTYVLGVKEFGTSFKNEAFKEEFPTLYYRSYSTELPEDEEIEKIFKLLTARMDQKMGSGTVTMIQNVGEIMAIEYD